MGMGGAITSFRTAQIKGPKSQAYMYFICYKLQYHIHIFMSQWCVGGDKPATRHYMRFIIGCKNFAECTSSVSLGENCLDALPLGSCAF